jgi:hypothetical protein
MKYTYCGREQVGMNLSNEVQNPVVPKKNFVQGFYSNSTSFNSEHLFI